MDELGVSKIVSKPGHRRRSRPGSRVEGHGHRAAWRSSRAAGAAEGRFRPDAMARSRRVRSAYVLARLERIPQGGRRDGVAPSRGRPRKARCVQPENEPNAIHARRGRKVDAQAPLRAARRADPPASVRAVDGVRRGEAVERGVRARIASSEQVAGSFERMHFSQDRWPLIGRVDDETQSACIGVHKPRTTPPMSRRRTARREELPTASPSMPAPGFRDPRLVFKASSPPRASA